MSRICVVDDNELMRESVVAALVRDDHRVEMFSDPIQALDALRTSSFDGIVTDLKMPKMDGLGLLREVRSAGIDVPVIMMTAHATVKTAVEALKMGAFDYIQKPFEADEMSLLVDRALQQHRLKAENEALRTQATDSSSGRELVGNSLVMKELLAKVEKVSRSQATVLIQGESGTGKEMLAWAVHHSSPRADRPMLCVNCAALSSDLLESELFGHEKGAFTGADRLRKGRFELADGGTLLLDEISELPLGLQAKLLRVLQEQQFERVGSSLTRTVDVRVVATTNRDLEDWVQEERFREDLFYRLSVLPLVLPPLRQRRGDVPPLVKYFLDRIARRDGRESLRVEPAAMRMLSEYDWPGNVRELENVCERATVLVSDGVLSTRSIESWLKGEVRFAFGLRNVRPGYILADMERQMIEETLGRFNGHREKTAKALGIGLRTLGMKLKKWRDEAKEAG
jgi:DNA-binding NtrC family response regulator